MNTTKKPWIVDDVQRTVEVGGFEVLEDGKIEIKLPKTHAGQIYAPEFVYATEEEAGMEIADRHTRLNQAFKSGDLLACLSINKEPSRKAEGATAKELAAQAVEDKSSYHRWVDHLKKDWEAINHEKADLQKLAQTLRNAQLIQDALSDPLAVDFTEIMAREARLKKIPTPGQNIE